LERRRLDRRRTLRQRLLYPWQAATFVGNSSGTWSYNTLSGAFSSNIYYRAFVRGIDRAGNTPVDPNFMTGGIRFNVDSSSPTSTVTSPVNGSILTAGITTMAGTAFDISVNGSGVSTVQVRIGRFSDGEYLNPLNGLFEAPGGTGSNFPLSATVTPGVLPNYTWSQSGTLLAGYFGDDKYHVESRATDNAGNFESTYSTITFTVDSTPPTTTITQPLTGNAYSVVQPLTNITGTSNDPNLFPSNVARVQLSVATTLRRVRRIISMALFSMPRRNSSSWPPVHSVVVLEHGAKCGEPGERGDVQDPRFCDRHRGQCRRGVDHVDFRL